MHYYTTALCKWIMHIPMHTIPIIPVITAHYAIPCPLESLLPCPPGPLSIDLFWYGYVGAHLHHAIILAPPCSSHWHINIF